VDAVAHQDSRNGITLEVRFDDQKKTDTTFGKTSTDGQGIFIGKNDFEWLYTSSGLGLYTLPLIHKDQKKLRPLVKRMIIGINEAFAGQMVARFDMPQNISELISACGLDK
jgi:hypothetical protein